MTDAHCLPGGADRGAVRVGDQVIRTAGPWTPAVHALLYHLAAAGFAGAPRPVWLDGSVERIGYLPGRTVGATRPWPAWVHSEPALVDVACWLRRYHTAVTGFRPPPRARWRESQQPWRLGLIIAHNDAAPYNAVWDDRGLVGFIDWDMAGPRHPDDDLAWVAFGWVPLHTPAVVMAEGFADFGARRARLERSLRAYGTSLGSEQVLARLDAVISAQIRCLHQNAGRGDLTYVRMLDIGRDRDLELARLGLAGI